MRSILLAGALALLLTTPAPAQSNDGFQRLHGQMYLVRNGQRRPMTHDAHLPTGHVVTKDGFVVAANGLRTELREGQGCDLRGRAVAVVPTSRGLALAAPPARTQPQPLPTVLARLRSNSPRGLGYAWGKHKKGKKHKGRRNHD
ncbi:hypothetical protein FY528_12525 [Hymenobacter lutimineralis]|uniref:DUF6799 domain-containing protein n=1 Tax=Hymenobacter lutimineralis TaxID=2606448 RepID=A0A5D6UY57_9BACT|nr:DUF6799 domain-containing protein [Hymenobacter lutimineralis]TYZ08691.1 hypothetical protein FY528_12525 [Hymenobacter lutimineralis]